MKKTLFTLSILFTGLMFTSCGGDKTAEYEAELEQAEQALEELDKSQDALEEAETVEEIDSIQKATDEAIEEIEKSH